MNKFKYFLVLTLLLFPFVSNAYTKLDVDISSAGIITDPCNGEFAGFNDFDIYFGTYPNTGHLLGDTNNGLCSDVSPFDYETNRGSIHGDGDYWYHLTNNNIDYYAVFNRENSLWTKGTSTNTTTRIISVTPPNASTTATSTNFVFSALVYVNADDAETDNYVRFRFVRDQNLQASVNVNSLYTNIDVLATTSGYMTISTTTSILNVGRYNLNTSIRNDTVFSRIVGFLGFGYMFDNNVLVATSTYFFASTSTALDLFVTNVTDSLDAFVASSTISTASCTTFSGFDLLDCLNLLFVPQTAQMATAFQKIKDGFFSYVPFGYVTRFVEILALPATSTLPVISYTFEGDFPVQGLENKTFTFDPWDSFFVAGSPLNDQIVSSHDGTSNLWDVVGDLYTTIIYLLLVFIIFNDLVKIHPNRHDV